MSVLVLGSSGQLARHLKEWLPGAQFWGRSTRDLGDAAGAQAAIVEARPEVIVNAAAYTAVDKAEDEPAAAWRVNAAGAAAAAGAAGVLDVPLIHVSTDYVFDGEKGEPYRDRDPTRPVNVYGRSKLAGELAVSSLCTGGRIIRASWVFSEFDGNFVTTMLRLAGEGKRLRVVSDQVGRPTCAGDLARAIAGLVTNASWDDLPPGTYHFAGGRIASWHEFATVVLSRANDMGILPAMPPVDAIATAEYPTRARRPLYAVLEPSERLEKALAFRPDWTAALDETLRRWHTRRSA